MATLTSARADSRFPVFKALGAGIVCAAYGSYDLSANPTAADIIQLCKLPAGATVIDGYFAFEDIDSNATEEVDIDLGWAGNGVESADPDGFGNFGVATGDAVAGYTPEAGTRFALGGQLANGFLSFTNETMVQAVVNVDAATFAAGTVRCVIYYVCS